MASSDDLSEDEALAPPRRRKGIPGTVIIWESREAVSELESMGVQVAMLSGNYSYSRVRRNSDVRQNGRGGPQCATPAPIAAIGVVETTSIYRWHCWCYYIGMGSVLAGKNGAGARQGRAANATSGGYLELEQRHRDIIDSHLYLNDLGNEEGPTLVLELNKRQVRLLLEALDHFRRTKCPANTGEGDCAMLGWSEDVHSGAIERGCTGSCEKFVEDIVVNKIPVTFSPKTPRAK